MNPNLNPQMNPGYPQPNQNLDFVQIKQKRKINVLLIPFILVTLMLLGASAFGFWAYSGYADNKDNVSVKVADAVANSKKEITASLEAQFQEREKQPYREFQGPAALGSVRLQYPKSWSAYIDYTSTSSPIKAYFHPKEIPATGTKDVKYALRAEVTNSPYAESLKAVDGLVKDGRVKTTPFENSGEKGVKIEGEIDPKVKSVMIMLPVRDKTLKVWTELPEYQKDLDNVVLKSLSFSR